MRFGSREKLAPSAAADRWVRSARQERSPSVASSKRDASPECFPADAGGARLHSQHIGAAVPAEATACPRERRRTGPRAHGLECLATIDRKQYGAASVAGRDRRNSTAIRAP